MPDLEIPDNSKQTGAASFAPASWNFKGDSFEDTTLQFQNPITGDWFGVWSAYQSDKRYSDNGRIAITGLTGGAYIQDVQAGYNITDIIIKKVSGAITLNIGITNTGKEILDDTSVTGNIIIVANQLYDADGSMYFNATGSGVLNVYLYFEKDIN